MNDHVALAKNVDQPIGGLIQDLKRRGLLDSTLVIWGGEFGRTPMGQFKNPSDAEDAGRDHHPEGFTMWMAGGGIRPGVTIGKTDDIGLTVAEDPVHVNDLQATILHCLGFDHTRLTYRHMGRDFRLTDVHGQVARKMLA
jgi:arylsulfatase A-like enzyme